ncbi:ABC transporter permease [Heliorestis convoluta]|uniref:Dipeptide transport system permease protein DppC n=1 Tax=Heliorestis convoluta TaxID=356322 RepID=A0A5Q2N2K6_9FIRM|nr:ABC transporter permease [Heliorestis convoluta]QGG49057.1 dipeptide transport system permease protein DppC [Heliorestis convoluta]
MSFSGRFSLIILVLFLLMALFAPWLTVHSYEFSSGPPLEGPSRNHLLGTDDLGVDLWSMLLYGARISLFIGLSTALLAGLGGTLIGMTAAIAGGTVDRILLRLIDVLVALPTLPLMIVAAAFLGSSTLQIILILAFLSWARPARIVRAQARVLQEQPYIKLARFYGASIPYLLQRHFVPELFPLLLVTFIRITSMAIVAEASLAFIGLGDPTARSWGIIMNHAINFQGIYYTPYWQWWLFYPWLLVTLLVMSLAMLGREVESVFQKSH